jgi:hypothetical protein
VEIKNKDVGYYIVHLEILHYSVYFFLHKLIITRMPIADPSNDAEKISEFDKQLEQYCGIVAHEKRKVLEII